MAKVQSSKGPNSRKIMESEFPDSMLIYTLCPKFLRSFQNKIICKKIRLMEFIQINICYTFFDDLLVMFVKHDNTEFKVVRYSEFKETQSIPENGKSYSSESF